MSTSQMSEVIRRLRGAALRDGPGLTDGHLLECFVGRGDGDAFAALVRRHGPMVWGVCRRILHTHHDAEDAFQATFLVLVRRARSVVPRQMVASWLYGVARRTAVKARALAAQRNRRERELAELAAPSAGERDARHDLRLLLDRELSRLPARYRTAIVLCDLEQKTRREVALQLGVPEGTLSGWLTRGRRMLAGRLSRQGPVLAGGVLSLLLTQQAASGCLPAAVVATTIETATLVAAGRAAAGTVTARVAALTEGVLKTMFWNRLKPGIALLVVLMGTLGLVAGIGARPPADGSSGARPVPASTEPPADKGAKVTTEEFYQYLVEMTLVKDFGEFRGGVGINGEHGEKTLATPHLMTREGIEASFFLGEERPFAGGKGREVEFLKNGLTVRVKLVRSGDGKIEMDSTLESSIVNLTGKTEAEVRCLTKRSIREVKLGETVKLELNDILSGKGCRVQIKVTDEEWVRRSSRHRSG
jgi:RNA polymerase sigma factor (sigma-70 family)